MHIDGLMLVLTVLLLSILIVINIIASISSFIKHIMSQSDVKWYQLQTWLPCLSGNDFQHFIASFNYGQAFLGNLNILV